jgi:hypothetical protein
MKVWVVTYEVNAYDQEGAYFQCGFMNKPTYEQALDLLHDLGVFNKNYTNYTGDYIENCVNKFLDGGGRIGTEHCWYNLSEEEFQ